MRLGLDDTRLLLVQAVRFTRRERAAGHALFDARFLLGLSRVDPRRGSSRGRRGRLGRSCDGNEGQHGAGKSGAKVHGLASGVGGSVEVPRVCRPAVIQRGPGRPAHRAA
jgi:hypothetical protein